MSLYADPVFAPLDRDHYLERLAGGNETEVYVSDDHRFVVKLKNDLGGDIQATLTWAKTIRAAADAFTNCLGPRHSIPNYYIISCDKSGQTQVVVIQPFIKKARQLYNIDYKQLSPSDRANLATELRNIIRRSLLMYHHTGAMPDLYGRTSASKDERRRHNTTRMLPQRLWGFLVKRNLLRSHNLLLVEEPQLRVVLVDYDPVRRNPLYKKIYYTVRWFLFWRDHLIIYFMQRGGKIPKR